ncbi:hypothetical protein TNIN_172441 [Trichonephila inaurata madagascariensis]|uniref:Uncharacterized protein n=1 Tax=Trichonephila inaurata madagascariensis TaxID=2747483 RepID=A0A8X6YF25_9ARAC|nr:hypothetical protein TNIN_172441 [Trichonephila inaurata madagascariensis]
MLLETGRDLTPLLTLTEGPHESTTLLMLMVFPASVKQRTRETPASAPAASHRAPMLGPSPLSLTTFPRCPCCRCSRRLGAPRLWGVLGTELPLWASAPAAAVASGFLDFGPGRSFPLPQLLLLHGNALGLGQGPPLGPAAAGLLRWCLWTWKRV